MKKKIKRKGFSLVEMLFVFFLLSIITTLSFYFYGKYVNSTNVKISEIELEGLKDAANSYYMEMFQDDSYKSSIETIDGIEYRCSCIKLGTLIKSGFYKNNKIAGKEYNIDKTVVLIKIKNSTNKYEYSVEENYSKYTDCN